jgi:hypothetical protein
LWIDADRGRIGRNVNHAQHGCRAGGENASRTASTRNLLASAVESKGRDGGDLALRQHQAAHGVGIDEPAADLKV